MLCLSKIFSKIIGKFLIDRQVQIEEFREKLNLQLNYIKDKDYKFFCLINYFPANLIMFYRESIGNHLDPICELYKNDDNVYLFDAYKDCVYLISKTDLENYKNKILNNENLNTYYSFENYDKFIKYCPRKIIRQFSKKEVKNMWKRYDKNLWNLEEIFNDL